MKQGSMRNNLNATETYEKTAHITGGGGWEFGIKLPKIGGQKSEISFIHIRALLTINEKFWLKVEGGVGRVKIRISKVGGSKFRRGQTCLERKDSYQALEHSSYYLA